MNNVSPIPIRGAFTGFDGTLDEALEGVTDFPESFSGAFPELPGVTLGDLGRLLFGFVAELELAGFAFGREVKNAPRTSS